MVLDLNPNYWGETPDVTHVEISVVPDASTMSMMFQSGEIDLLDCDYIDSAVVDSTYRTQYADQIVTGNRLATTYLALNENIEPLGDVRACARPSRWPLTARPSWIRCTAATATWWTGSTPKG